MKQIYPMGSKGLNLCLKKVCIVDTPVRGVAVASGEPIHNNTLALGMV